MPPQLFFAICDHFDCHHFKSATLETIELKKIIYKAKQEEVNKLKRHINV